MMTIFKSHNLLGCAENGYELPSDEKQMVEKQLIVAQDLISRDAKALRLIQSTVSDGIFFRIANQETFNKAWDVLKQEYKGDYQVMAMKLQGIRLDFENARMSNGESLFDYWTRQFALVSQMKMHGEDLLNKIMVEKLYISLTPTQVTIVSFIEGTKKISEIDPTESTTTPKGFEQR